MKFLEYVIYDTVKTINRERRKEKERQKRAEQREKKQEIDRRIKEIEREIKRLENAPPPPDALDLQGKGKAGEHLARFRQIFQSLVDGSGETNDFLQPINVASLYLVKTAADMIMMGAVPAADKIMELDLFMVCHGLDIGVDARTFLIDLSRTPENRMLDDSIFREQDENGEPSGFWRIAEILSVKCGDSDQLLKLYAAYHNFATCFTAEMDRKYPGKGYDVAWASQYAQNTVQPFIDRDTKGGSRYE